MAYTSPINQKMQNNSPHATQTYIIKDHIRKKINELGCKVKPEYYTELNNIIEQKIAQSIQRAQANNRKTVKQTDL